MPNISPQAMQNLNSAITYYSQNPNQPKTETKTETKTEGRGFLEGILNNPNLGSLVTEATRTIQGVQNLRQGASSTDVNPCGRKPLFGKRKKEEWQQCTNSWVASQVDKGIPQPYIEETGRNYRPLIIGAVVIAIGVIGVIIYKKMNK